MLIILEEAKCECCTFMMYKWTPWEDNIQTSKCATCFAGKKIKFDILKLWLNKLFERVKK